MLFGWRAIVVMGVSGVGKTTVAVRVAAMLG
jgi:adenylate kinase